MFFTKILLFMLALSYIKYAKNRETIIIDEWLTQINTKANLTIAKLAIIIDLTLFVIVQAIANMPTTTAILNAIKS